MVFGFVVVIVDWSDEIDMVFVAFVVPVIVVVVVVVVFVVSCEYKWKLIKMFYFCLQFC